MGFKAYVLNILIFFFQAGFIGANGELLSVKAEPIVSLSQSMPKRRF